MRVFLAGTRRIEYKMRRERLLISFPAHMRKYFVISNYTITYPPLAHGDFFTFTAMRRKNKKIQFIYVIFCIFRDY